MKKYVIIYTVLSFAIVFLYCSELLVSETQNPAPPDKVTLYNPSNIYANGATLFWTKPKSENFAAYKIYFDTNPGVTEKNSLAGCVTFKDDTSYLFKNLESETAYYVKVFVHNSASFSESNEITFYTTQCTCGVFTGEKQDNMILIPAGCFIGKDNSIATISYNFYMDTTEVTINDWNEVMSSASIIDTTGISIDKWKYILGFDTSTSIKPITQISRYQMIVFCNEKSKKHNRDTCYTYTSVQIDTNNSCIREITELKCDFDLNGLRLPTEDEWEYAYRAGGKEEYYWGKDGNTLMEYPYTATYPKTTEDSSEISEYAWWGHNNDPNEAKDVARRIPNIWHLYDMAGNVEETLWDIVSVAEREKNRIDYKGPDIGPQSLRRSIVRGGVFNSSKHYILTAWWRQSSLEFNCTFSDAVGLRTVCTHTP